MAAPSVAYGSLPFAEQIAFFRGKISLPTEAWDDILGAAHDRAFVVAGAAKADLLTDLRAAVDRAIAEGTTLAAFRQDFDALVAKNGWKGWTGEGSKGGRAWRTDTIYHTNLLTSYAAGRYEQLQSLKGARPYWQYRHSDAVLHPRKEHLAWDGKVLHADDAWWSTHYPPKGFGCRCQVRALSDSDIAAQRITPATGEAMPYNGTYQHTSRRVDRSTGEVTEETLTLPLGVDKGWDYAPGANARTPLQTLIDRKLIRMPPLIARAMMEALADVLRAEAERAAAAAAAARAPNEE